MREYKTEITPSPTGRLRTLSSMHAVPGSSFRPLTATKVIKQLTVKQHAILLYCTNTKEESMSWLYRGYIKPKDSPSPRGTSPLARVHQNHTTTNSNKSNHLLPQEKGKPLPPPSSLFENETRQPLMGLGTFKNPVARLCVRPFFSA